MSHPVWGNVNQHSDEIRPAATLVLLRQGDGAVETLLLQRSSRGFASNQWVFPGGGVDAVDQQPDGDTLSAARQAAVRELAEEAGLQSWVDDLMPFAHWLAPKGTPKRFSTWFFVTTRFDGELQIDGAEIVDSCWIEPAAALVAHERGELGLLPPTLATLHWLAHSETVKQACEALAARGMPAFEPVVLPQYEQLTIAYVGDHELGGDCLHRVQLNGKVWRYYDQLPLDA